MRAVAGGGRCEVSASTRLQPSGARAEHLDDSLAMTLSRASPPGCRPASCASSCLVHSPCCKSGARCVGACPHRHRASPRRAPSLLVAHAGGGTALRVVARGQAPGLRAAARSHGLGHHQRREAPARQGPKTAAALCREQGLVDARRVLLPAPELTHEFVDAIVGRAVVAERHRPVRATMRPVQAPRGDSCALSQRDELVVASLPRLRLGQGRAAGGDCGRRVPAFPLAPLPPQLLHRRPMLGCAVAVCL